MDFLYNNRPIKGKVLAKRPWNGQELHGKLIPITIINNIMEGHADFLFIRIVIHQSEAVKQLLKLLISTKIKDDEVIVRLYMISCNRLSCIVVTVAIGD